MYRAATPTPHVRPITLRLRILRRLVASAVCVFAASQAAQGAAIEANGSGSLLGGATATQQSAAVGALTLKPLATVGASFPAGEPALFDSSSMASIDRVFVRNESSASVNLAPIYDQTSWLVPLCAAGAALWLARAHWQRRHLVPVRNT